jgi:hypothetical protein
VASHAALGDREQQLLVMLVLQAVHLHLLLLLLLWLLLLLLLLLLYSCPVTGQHGIKPWGKPNTCCRATAAALDDAATLFGCVSMLMCREVERMLWL